MLARDLQWIDLLPTAVDRAQQVSHSCFLDPPGIIDEAVQWLSDPRPYDKSLHQRAWRSCLSDLEASLTALGPALSATISGERARVLSLTRGLLGAKPTADDRRLAIAALEQLVAVLVKPSALVAAWHDLIGSVKAEDRPLATLTFRADVFLSLLRAGGRNVESTTRLISGVIADRAFSRLEILYVLGDVAPDDSQSWPTPDDAAGMSIHDRLDLCERLLAAEPAPRHHVVWVGFERAGLRLHPGVTAGSVAFYDADVIRSAVLAGRGGALALPDELFTGWLAERDIPNRPDVVLARVDLGTCVESDPPRRAASLAESVVAAAVFRTGPMSFPVWRPLSGFLHAIDGNIVTVSWFSPHAEVPGRREAYEMAGAELETLVNTSLADPTLNEHGLKRLRALRWFHDAEGLDGPARLLLDVRVLELIATTVQRTDPKWWKYIDRYWKDAWVRHIILNEVAFSIRDAARPPIMPQPDADASSRAEVNRLLADVLTPLDNHRHQVNIRQAVTILPDLTKLFSMHSWRGRRLRNVAKYTRTIAALRRWTRVKDTEWDALLARAQRCRDAFAHGGPINDRVTASGSQFAHQLAAFALSVDLEAVVEGRDVSTKHEELAGDARWWRANLRNETDVGAALEPWSPDGPTEG